MKKIEEIVDFSFISPYKMETMLEEEGNTKAMFPRGACKWNYLYLIAFHLFLINL
jgi:hypothetical protein